MSPIRSPVPIPAAVALAAAAVASLSAFGPWATGMYRTEGVFGASTTTLRSVEGASAGGIVIAAPAFLAIVAFAAFPLRLRARYALACALLAVSALCASWVLLNGGIGFAPDFNPFGGWREVDVRWGIQLATAGAFVGVAACVAGIVRSASRTGKIQSGA